MAYLTHFLIKAKKTDPEAMAMQAIESENTIKKLNDELQKTIVQITKPDQKAAALAAQASIQHSRFLHHQSSAKCRTLFCGTWDLHDYAEHLFYTYPC